MNDDFPTKENNLEPEIELTYPVQKGVIPSSFYFVHPDKIDYVEPNGSGCIVIMKDGGRLPAGECRDEIERQIAKYR